MANWQRLKRFSRSLDNYRLSTLLTTFGALGLFIAIAALGGFVLPVWFLALFAVPAFFSNLVSGASYIGRLVDGLSMRKKSGKTVVATALNKDTPASYSLNKVEVIGTILGVLVGIGVALAVILSGGTIMFGAALPIAAQMIFTMTCISIFGGLGNRFCTCVSNGGRLRNEKIAMFAAMAAMALTATFLFIFTNVGMLTIMGVTTLFTGGLALPVWLVGLMFVGSATSAAGSCTDYLMRSINYLRYEFGSTDQALMQHIAKRKHEHRGALVGTVLAIALAITLIVLLAVFQPQIIAGAMGILAATMIIIVAIGAIGGLCSRIGRFYDAYCNLPKETEIERPAPVQPTNTLALLPSIDKPEPSQKLILMRELHSSDESVNARPLRSPRFFSAPTTQSQVPEQEEEDQYALRRIN